jgi:N-acetylmuramoyl-L-alanine amidase
LIQHYPDSEFADDAYYWKAHAYVLKEDYKRAVEEYEELTRNYPRSGLRGKAGQQIEECRAKLGGQRNSETEEHVVSTASKDHIPKPPPKSPLTPLWERGEPPEKPGESVPEVSTHQIYRKPKPAIEQQPPSAPKTVPIEDSEAQPQQEKSGKTGEYLYVEDIRFHSGPEFTRVVIDLSGPVKFKAGRLGNPDRIYVDLLTAAITPPKQDVPINDRAVKSVRAAQFDEDTVRMVLDVQQIQSYDISCLKEPDRLVVDVYGTGILPSKPSAPEHQGSLPLVKQLGLKVKTIVIDPGHGGKDPGAVSRSGLQEKHMVLDVAKRLKDLLEDSGTYHVYLTRENDVFIPLEERTTFANQKQADIFISIHINSCTRPEARGVETYYLSLASDEEARATAALENASAGKTIKDLGNLLHYILRGAKVKESRELARNVQSRLCQHTGSSDRGVRRAPFIVLIGAKAPSILVELGFISNRQDELLLRSDQYRDKLAQALKEAVEDYIKTIDQAS